jgi:hypothetical protein
MKFIDSTCFGHQHAHHQECRWLLPHLVANPGKPPKSRSSGLLDVWTARRMWPDGTYSVRKKILVRSEAFGSVAMNYVYTFRLSALTVVCTVQRMVKLRTHCMKSLFFAIWTAIMHVTVLHKLRVPFLTFMFECFKACYTRCSCSPASSSDNFSGFCISVSVVEDSVFHYSDFTGVACERELIQLEWPH